MAEPRLEQIFREETRRVLGAERVTAERLIQLIEGFASSATPMEAFVFAEYVRGLASKLPAAPFSADVGPGSPTAGAAPTTPAPAEAPHPAQRVRPAGPSRVTYPAPIRGPRAVAPEPMPAPEPEPPADDIEDFTAAATGP